MNPVLLLVDDDPGILAFLRPLFAGAGYTVELAEDGAVARRLLERRKVDLVITDLYMPDEDGFEVLQYCMRERPDLPVIVLTGRHTAPFDPLPMARRFGAVAALRKPVLPEVLLETVRQALERNIPPDEIDTRVAG